jgi:hypothetical protein
MWLYVIGAFLLQLNILAAAWVQYERLGHMTTAMGVYVLLFTWFIVEVRASVGQGLCRWRCAPVAVPPSECGPGPGGNCADAVHLP